LHAGERYDFKLCADQGGSLSSKTFKIVAEAPELCEPDFLQRNGFPTPESCRFEAILRYEKRLIGKSATVPTDMWTLDLASSESFDRVRPVEAPPSFNDSPDQSFELRLGVLENGRMFLHTSPQPWKLPSSPLLMTKGLACADDVPLITIDENATDVELLVHNELADVHVVHLHGLRFHVVSQTQCDGRSIASSGAVLRDTVPVPAGGSVVIRLRADNPGMWMFHAMSVNALHRGAATVLNVLPSAQPEVPTYVPTHLCSDEVQV